LAGQRHGSRCFAGTNVSGGRPATVALGSPDHKAHSGVAPNKPPLTPVAFLSWIALQIYLLQELFVQDARIKALPFPTSGVVFWLLVLPSAWLFNNARKFFSRRESGSATGA